MSKKTAIQELSEWFEEFYSTDVSREKFKVAIEEDKQQIKDSYNQGYRDGERDAQSQVSEKDIADFDDAENYYNETYKS